MNVDKLKNELMTIISHEGKMGPSYGSIKNYFEDKLDEKEKKEAREIIIDLINSEDDWRIMVGSKDMISISQARAIGACGILNIQEAVPKIIDYFKRKRTNLFQQEENPLYSAIADLQIHELVEYLNNDLEGIEWAAQKAHFQNDIVKRSDVPGRPIKAFHALTRADLNMAMEYAIKYIPDITNAEDGRLQFIVSAFYAKYADDVSAYLNKEIKNNVPLAVGILYELYMMWQHHHDKLKPAIDMFNLLHDDMRRSVEEYIVEDIKINGEFPVTHNLRFSKIKLCQLLKIELEGIKEF